MLTYKVLDDTVPRYLRPLTLVTDVSGWRTLQSAAATNHIAVLSFKLSTINFLVAASESWNALVDNVVSASSINSFHHQLKTLCVSVISLWWTQHSVEQLAVVACYVPLSPSINKKNHSCSVIWMETACKHVVERLNCRTQYMNVGLLLSHDF